MQLDLSNEEGKVLATELARRIDELDRELVRTDKHELQVALSRDIEHLRAVHQRLGQAIATGR